VDGIGQGDEGGHDVWRAMAPVALDDVRILSVQTDAGVRIEAEAAAAYPAKASLRYFRRTFRFTAPGTFTVSDDVQLSSPRAIQWYLQSDTKPRHDEAGWALGDEEVGLRVVARLPRDARIDAGPTIVMAPGAPGSITSGNRDQRGYHLVLESRPATRHRFEVELIVERHQHSRD
jgi:hypothetical protein